MSTSPAVDRRYLVPFHTRQLPHIFTDCLVIGCGVAGLRAAVEVADSADVLVLGKDRFELSNTYHAQGGIAAALGDDDSVELHLRDTLSAGNGLCDAEAARSILAEAPERIEELVRWGAKFDRVGSRIALTREGGHSRARIVHAQGDATGREVAETLLRQASSKPRAKLCERLFVVDLLTAEGRCVGALVFDPKLGLELVWAGVTILATGGTGVLYRETTNPHTATGDGDAIAYRAGAVLRDMEMVQFHPTTLYVAGAARALISEAVRGEGAVLVDKNGHRFMPDYHPDAELAPRDVVSRSIVEQMSRTGHTSVYLDATHIPREKLFRRFPHIAELCQQFDLDISADRIPVRPSAHYMMGGLQTDAYARTTLPHLLACGEAANTGLHGANRLGSNSLLEGLVMGRRAGLTALELLAGLGRAGGPYEINSVVPVSERTKLDIADVRSSLRALMWRNVGIVRNGPRLEETIEIIEFWRRYVMDKTFHEPAGWELQNMLTVALLISRSASQRRESRGAHYRVDFPQPHPEMASHHICQRYGNGS